MLLASTYRLNVKEDIPVIIVCFGDRKVFMLKANTYSKMVSKIRQKFDIHTTRQLCLKTAALDVCRGSEVEIGGDVWSVLMSSLDEVTVVVSGGDLDRASPDRALAQTGTEIGTPVFAEEDGVGVKEEYVENWLEQQNEAVDDAPPPPSMYSAIEDEDGHQVSHHIQDQYEYQVNVFLEPEEEAPLVPERSPNVRFDAEEQELHRDEAQVGEPQRPTSTTDDRFQVSIDGPELDQTAEIKTRGKHLVRKVLAAVCKTFDLDYDRSSLYMVTYTLNSGRMEESLILCPPDWSVARCGITSVTELRIHLDSPSASETVASHAAQRSM